MRFLDPALGTSRIPDKVINVMASLAEWERDLLVQRTREGVAHARAEGRVYGHDATTEADNRGGRVYGHNDDMDARGARVYGLGDRGAVSHEQATADATATPERWRLDEVRPVTAAGSYDDLDVIGARIDARHHAGGAVTVDNRHGRDNDTPGLAGFDY